MSRYIPEADAACFEWVRYFVQYGSANSTRWGLASDAFDPISTANQAFRTALDRCNLPATSKLDTAAKNVAKKVLVSAVRQFINQFLRYNPSVTDLDRVALGLPVADPVKTPGSKPSGIPEIEPRVSRIRSITLHVKNAGSKERGKPRGVHGVEIRLEIRSDRPKEPEDLTRSEFSTKTIVVFDFSEEDRGKTVFFCARWENNTGEKGEWGEIISAVIP